MGPLGHCNAIKEPGGRVLEERGNLVSSVSTSSAISRLLQLAPPRSHTGKVGSISVSDRKSESRIEAMAGAAVYSGLPCRWLVNGGLVAGFVSHSTDARSYNGPKEVGLSFFLG